MQWDHPLLRGFTPTDEVTEGERKKENKVGVTVVIRKLDLFELFEYCSYSKLYGTFPDGSDDLRAAVRHGGAGAASGHLAEGRQGTLLGFGYRHL